jgi:uracil-DNA glycosylase family 4
VSRSRATRRRELVRCDACPRLVAWREQVARDKRAMYREQRYWGRPVPGFGDAAARLVIVGLAPGAHGANRTGRAFTGDRSGDFLFAALHRAGLASQPHATSQEDGLELRGAFITLAGRCAPPGNRPTPEELGRCAHWLDRELHCVQNARVFLALGAIAWSAALDHLSRLGEPLPRPAPKFAHGAQVSTGRAHVLGSYHVSQQNTQTGRLTPAMFDAILARAIELTEPRRGRA